MRKKKLVRMFILILIDQVIKIIIHFNFMNIKVTFLKGNLGFTPYLNKDKLSINNLIFNRGLSLNNLIIRNIISIILIFLIYKDYKKKDYVNNHFENGCLLMSAGAFSSLIDKLTLGGSLDYILIINYIVDLKDIYLSLGLIAILISGVTAIKHKYFIKNN